MAMVIRDGSLKEEGMERKKIWQRSMVKAQNWTGNLILWKSWRRP
jgi:hypothetical protein